MKRSMKKFMVTCAAVSAIAAVASVSAMAEAVYTADGNSLTYGLPTADAGTQMTVLVVPKDAEVTDENIYYIDQAEALTGSALLKGDKLEDGTYVVKVGYTSGGEFAIQSEEFTLGEVIPPVDTTDVLLGNVVGTDATINATDAQQVLKYYVTGTAGFAADPYKLVAANVAGTDATINATDAQQILKYYVVGSVTTNVGKTAKVNANYEVVEIVD